MCHSSQLFTSGNLRDTDLVGNFPLAWHFWAKISSPVILVGLVAFTTASTEDDEAGLLRLLFALMQGGSIFHLAAVLAGPLEAILEQLQ